MARSRVPRNYFTFVGGKISDSNPLNPVPNSARTLMNVDLEPNGKISRRLGLDLEPNHVVDNGPYTLSELQTVAVDTFEWFNVDNSSNATFFVLRVGNVLHFYDESVEPFSSGKIDEIDIGAFASDPSAAAKEGIQAVSGKGLLFVAGGRYDPFYIEYDPLANTFTATEIILKIRDFDGLDDGLDPQERPSSLSALHKYNLRNQGWTQSNINTFKSQQGMYPSNADIEWLGYYILPETGNRTFSSNEIVKQSLGNSISTKGHYILDAFDKNRVGVSGILGLPIEGTTFRPEAIAFYSGRVWYASVQGEIFFSQIVSSTSNIDKCYQQNDPAAEELNELLDTDGGVIRLLEAGTVKKLVNTPNGLAVFASNGIWSISGGDTGFSANVTLVEKVSSLSILNPNTIVEAEGNVFFWGEEGIYALTTDQVSAKLTATSLSDNRIKTDYDAIPVAAKKEADVAYDRVSKRVYWAYHDGQVSNGASLDPKYNSCLILDLTTSAFWDYKISDFPGTYYSPFMAGLVKRSAVNEGESTTRIVVNGEPVVTEGGTFNIVSTATFEGASDTPLKALCFIPDENQEYEVTFGEFCSRSFTDWFTIDQAGINYESIVETSPESLGEGSLDKQATYLFTFFDYKRGGFGELLFSSRFEAQFGFRVTQNVVEVLRAGLPKLRSTQNVVEVLRAVT